MPTAIRLQPRDLDMLHSLGVARFLTVQALEWLHYPSWRENWTKHQQQPTPKRSYYPAPNLYRRLEGMRGGGYLVNIKRAQERATVSFNRLADVCALTNAGAELLAEYCGIDIDQLSVHPKAPRALQNLEHSVTIAQFYAALRSQLESMYADDARPVSLVGWQADHQLARNYDRLKDVVVRRNDQLAYVDLPVLPDAAFEVVRGETRRRYFLEMDRGTRPLDSWREKAEAYKRYYESAELQARYSVKHFVLLIVAPTQTRIERIAQTIAKVERKPTMHYVYAKVADIHPLTLQAQWQTAEKVVMHQRRVADKIFDDPAVTMAQSPLWNIKRSNAL